MKEEPTGQQQPEADIANLDYEIHDLGHTVWLNFKFITRQQSDLIILAIAQHAQLRAEVELYLTRMADQEATIRELSELKESWKKRIAELEAALSRCSGYNNTPSGYFTKDMI